MRTKGVISRKLNEVTFEFFYGYGIQLQRVKSGYGILLGEFFFSFFKCSKYYLVCLSRAVLDFRYRGFFLVKLHDVVAVTVGHGDGIGSRIQWMGNQ